ncbi:MAG: rhomboid family intramembrane serine protease [Lentisphaeria bacterium]
MKWSYNAPLILTFAFVSVLVLAIDSFVVGGIKEYFMIHPGPMIWNSPRSYFQLFTYVLGHSNWNHLMGNMTFLLLVGPLLEEKYGTFRLAAMMAITALLTGLINVFFLDTGLIGASGIVFMMILLSSLANLTEDSLPLTLVLVALFFVGSEVIAGLNQHDQVSRMAHIVGGFCGAFLGLSIFKVHSAK